MSGFWNREPSNGWRKVRRPQRCIASIGEAVPGTASTAHNREVAGPTLAGSAQYLSPMNESPVISYAERRC
jgi:hypothetical protein